MQLIGHVSLGYYSLGVIPPLYKKRVSHQPERLASKIWGPSCLYLPFDGITGMRHHVRVVKWVLCYLNVTSEPPPQALIFVN